MAISYNIIERGEPGVAGGGDTKFYASAKMTGEVSINKLIERIEKISTVSGADVRAVLYALVDVIPDGMSDSNIVRIDGLGSFRISISSEGHETAEDVNATSIKKSRIIFTPGDKLQNMLKTLSFEKLNNGS